MSGEQPFFFGEDKTQEDVDKRVDEWATDMTEAMGTLVTEGYFVMEEGASERVSMYVLSDGLRFTPKGRDAYVKVAELVLPALPDGPGMPEYYGAARWLIDNGHITDLNLHAVYGLLTWGTQIWNEDEERNEMGDGFRRRNHKKRPLGFKLRD